MNSPVTRVLYIDDDRINTLLFVQVCRPDSSIEVLTAATAEEALETAREKRPAVLVIDLHMPDGDGLQLLGNLRQIDGLADVPAFLCTAERPEEVHNSAVQAGFVGIWSKPVQLSTIRDDLSRALA